MGQMRGIKGLSGDRKDSPNAYREEGGRYSPSITRDEDFKVQDRQSLWVYLALHLRLLKRQLSAVLPDENSAAETLHNRAGEEKAIGIVACLKRFTPFLFRVIHILTIPFLQFSRDTLWDVPSRQNNVLLSTAFLLIVCSSPVLCNEGSSVKFYPPTNEAINRLADSIFWAEGGYKTRHPYGILAHYKVTTPRQACLNTIKTNIRKYKASGLSEDFITFMSRSYCPLNDPRDVSGLNKNWVRNVKLLYKEGKKVPNGASSGKKVLARKGHHNAHL